MAHLGRWGIPAVAVTVLFAGVVFAEGDTENRPLRDARLDAIARAATQSYADALARFDHASFSYRTVRVPRRAPLADLQLALVEASVQVQAPNDESGRHRSRPKWPDVMGWLQRTAAKKGWGEPQESCRRVLRDGTATLEIDTGLLSGRLERLTVSATLLSPELRWVWQPLADSVAIYPVSGAKSRRPCASYYLRPTWLGRPDVLEASCEVSIHRQGAERYSVRVRSKAGDVPREFVYQIREDLSWLPTWADEFYGGVHVGASWYIWKWHDGFGFFPAVVMSYRVGARTEAMAEASEGLLRIASFDAPSLLPTELPVLALPPKTRIADLRFKPPRVFEAGTTERWHEDWRQYFTTGESVVLQNDIHEAAGAGERSVHPRVGKGTSPIPATK